MYNQILLYLCTKDSKSFPSHCIAGRWTFKTLRYSIFLLMKEHILFQLCAFANGVKDWCIDLYTVKFQQLFKLHRGLKCREKWDITKHYQVCCEKIPVRLKCYLFIIELIHNHTLIYTQYKDILHMSWCCVAVASLIWSVLCFVLDLADFPLLMFEIWY